VITLSYITGQYFCDPEATKKAMRGGWYNLGDLAVHHPDGTIALMDRSKDIIISGGEVIVALFRIRTIY
jgi:fatty-acyl-CoA synthase